MGRKAYIKISKYRPSLFQGKLDFSTSKGVSLTHEHPLERLLQHALLGALVFLACLYLYFVTATVLNVIAREDAISRVARIEGSIGALEQRHFALSQSVDASSAHTVGLTEVSRTSYVYRPGNVGAATIARNEI